MMMGVNITQRVIDEVRAVSEHQAELERAADAALVADAGKISLATARGKSESIACYAAIQTIQDISEMVSLEKVPADDPGADLASKIAGRIAKDFRK